MITTYITGLLSALLLSTIGILLSLKYFPKWGIVDRREAHSTHIKTAVRGGGLAIGLTFFVVAFALGGLSGNVQALVFPALIVLIINFLDDAFNINRYLRLATDIGVGILVITSGVGIETITSPFGGFWDLTGHSFMLGSIEISPIADTLALLWIVAMMNVLNWVDGLDGLAGGIAAITAFVLFGLSLLPIVNQPTTALLAIILFGSIMGFLPFNFFAGSIKLGDTGAKFLGFTLAVLALINQGKFATFALVLGLPLFDFGWVLFRRICIEKKSPFHGDTGHFHHRLLRAGFSRRSTVLIMWCISAIFGSMALFLSTAWHKLLGLIGMGIFLLLLAVFVYRKEEKVQ